MSTPYPQGEDGRPLTRRELRELAERQVVQSAQVRPEPSAPPATLTADQAQARQHPQNAFPAQPPQGLQPVQNPPQQDFRQAPQFGDHNSQPSGYPVESFTFSEPRQGEPTSSLQPRPVSRPVEQPVQVSRRSMHQMPQGAGIPQVTPPSQAGAVRMLEETGTISNLVDPSLFEPSNEPVNVTGTPVAAPARASAFGASESFPSSQSGRSNLSGFMRQAPPSSQIPRVVQDSEGNWTAASPHSVQDQFENSNSMLPSWGDTSKQLSGFNAATSQGATVFAPERSESAPSMPARNSALNSMRNTQGSQPIGESGAGFGSNSVGQSAVPTFATVPNQPEAGNAFGGVPSAAQQGPHTPNALQQQFPQQGFGQQSFGIQGSSWQGSAPQGVSPQQTASAAPPAPAWDAITAVNSTLPQDPTIGGVSAAAVLTGEMAPIASGVSDTQSQLAVGQSNTGIAGQNGLVTAPAFPPVQQQGVDQEPALFSPVNGGAIPAQDAAKPFSEFGQDELDGEDEDFDIDHSYTWLQYMILIAVAFVLGMIIWRVAMDPDRQGTEEPADASPYSNAQVFEWV